MVGNNYGEIVDCGSVAVVDSYNYSGGLVAYNSGTLFNCFSTSIVSGRKYVGGFAGHNRGIITWVFSLGNVSGVIYVGGFIGYNDYSISTCFAVGDVYLGTNVGRFYGEGSEYAEIDNFYYCENQIASGHQLNLDGINVTIDHLKSENWYTAIGFLPNYWDCSKVSEGYFPTLIGLVQENLEIPKTGEV